MKYPVGFPRCPACGSETEVNGIGSTIGFLNKSVTIGLKIFLPISVRVFKQAAEIHDWKYSIYGFSKDVADREFYRDMLLSLQDLPWYFKPFKNHLRSTAYYFFKAVQYKGHEAYHEAQLQCLENQACLCADGLDCDLHPRPYPA